MSISRKAAGVVSTVYAVSQHVINIQGTITIESGYSFTDIQTAASAAVDLYFSDLEIGKTFRASKLIDALMGIDGVVDVTLTTPTSNSTPDWNAICCKGTCTFTEG